MWKGPEVAFKALNESQHDGSTRLGGAQCEMRLVVPAGPWYDSLPFF